MFEFMRDGNIIGSCDFANRETFSQYLTDLLYHGKSMLELQEVELPKDITVGTIGISETRKTVSYLDYDSEKYGLGLKLPLGSPIQVLYAQDSYDMNKYQVLTLQPMAVLHNKTEYVTMDGESVGVPNGCDWDIDFEKKDIISLSELQIMLESGIIAEEDVMNKSLKCLFPYQMNYDEMYRRAFEGIFVKNSKEPLITSALYSKLENLNYDLNNDIKKSVIAAFVPHTFLYDFPENQFYETDLGPIQFASTVLDLKVNTAEELKDYGFLCATVTKKDIENLLNRRQLEKMFRPELLLAPISELNKIPLPYINHALNVNVNDSEHLIESIKKELASSYKDWIIPANLNQINHVRDYLKTEKEWFLSDIQDEKVKMQQKEQMER